MISSIAIAQPLFHCSCVRAVITWQGAEVSVLISTMPVISVREVLSFFLGCVIFKALELAPVAWALHLDDCGTHANRDSRNLNPDSFSNRVAIPVKNGQLVGKPAKMAEK